MTTASVDGSGGRVLEDVFRAAKPVIGTIHVLPLPGAPRYSGQAMRDVVRRAVSDAEACVAGGIDGLIIENEGDIPFRKPELVGPETVAGLTAVTTAVRDAVSVPLGINCLANAVVQSLAIAKATGGVFVRANQWANAYVANEGIVEGAAAEALRFRAAIRGEDIRVLADVHVKHGSHAIVADRDIAEQTRDVEAFDADVLIATGNRTGDATRVEEVREVKAATRLPVLVGSGLTPGNAVELLSVADGVIVGSSLKRDGVWWNEVQQERVEALMAQVISLR